MVGVLLAKRVKGEGWRRAWGRNWHRIAQEHKSTATCGARIVSFLLWRVQIGYGSYVLIKIR